MSQACASRFINKNSIISISAPSNAKSNLTPQLQINFFIPEIFISYSLILHATFFFITSAIVPNSSATTGNQHHGRVATPQGMVYRLILHSQGLNHNSSNNDITIVYPVLDLWRFSIFVYNQGKDIYSTLLKATINKPFAKSSP